MSTYITDITAEILKNSRGTNTIAVTVTAGEYQGTFMVPEGASTGSREVRALPVHDALRIIAETIKPKLVGVEVTEQSRVDLLLHELDGTQLFEVIGGNVALGVSIASAKAAAASLGIPVWQHIRSLFKGAPQAHAPRLFINLINGGKHAKSGSPIQEHQIIVDTDDVALAYQTACTIQEKLRTLVVDAYGEHAVGHGDEGGFVIPSTSVFEPFEHLTAAIKEASVSVKVAIGTDIAASSFYDGQAYLLEGTKKDASELLEFYSILHSRVPLLATVEDPFFESDFVSYAAYVAEHQDVLVIGDDLTTTNSASLQKAIDAHAITAIIIKPNQIGTLSDTLATMELAYAHDIKCIVSHRSGETMDDFIADLAWGTSSYGLKAGAPFAKERDAKYNRLITISNTNHA